MKNSIEIVSLLQSTNSKKDKEQILRDNKRNDEFTSIMQFVFDSYITTGISNKKLSKFVNINATKKLDSIYDVINEDIIITDRDKIIAISGSMKKKYNEKNISKQIEEFLDKRKIVIEKE